MTAYVRIDLHRRRSLAVCLDHRGERLSWKRYESSPQTLIESVTAAGPDPEVVMEATWAWYRAVDVLADRGIGVHPAHPLGIEGFENRRLKNDLKDAEMLANLLRLGSLPESWIAPRSLRELRRAGAVPPQAVAAAHRSQVAGPCRVGQRRHASTCARPTPPVITGVVRLVIVLSSLTGGGACESNGAKGPVARAPGQSELAIATPVTFSTCST